MKLQEIYDKEITRYINPAVVVSELDDNLIHQEISEYIFTDDIIENIYKFLHAFTNKKEGKTGIWISGYYGSGKSHFIKYLFYCLKKTTRKEAFDHLKNAIDNTPNTNKFSDATVSNIQLIQNELDKAEIEENIFNIDAVSGDKKDKNAITRILINQLNARRGYNNVNIPVALLVEKHLDKLGRFEDFKKKVKDKTGEEWISSNVRNFVSLKLSKIIDIVHEIDETVDKESLRDSIKKDEDYTIDEFIKELQEYVSSKQQKFKLIFFIDEVSQYIGSDSSLLLNLQTIVEEIGAKLGDKVWITSTAQQDLSSLIQNTENKSEGFGKIMGRFETLISLDSQDVAYITQKRILEKNTAGLQALIPFYKENKGGIENQFVFGHDLYQNYKGADDFYLAYPFIPYQFRLISDVFQSFSNVGFVSEGVKNTERSILGITHFTAQQKKDDDLGYFISFDDFFNNQFISYLTHPANSILNKAYQIKFDSIDEAFAIRVIRLLFMVSNLDDASSVNLPSTVENLALLLINDISSVKVDLQKKVQKVLDVLVEQNIVQTAEGKYRFLDDEGIKVANAISNTEVNASTRLEYFYDQLIKKLLKPDPTISIGNRSIRIGLSIDDKVMTTGDAFNVRFMVYDASSLDDLALNVSGGDLCIGINEWFNSDVEFKKDFLNYSRTAKYLSDNKAIATGSRLKTLETFAANNAILLKDLQIRFEKYFQNTRLISRQLVVSAHEISSATSVALRYADMVGFHVKQVFKNHEWSNSFAQNNADLQNAITKGIAMPTLDNELDVAEQEVNNKISLSGNEVSLADLVKTFEKAPYGWKDLATLHIVFNLARKKHRAVFYQNEEIDLPSYFDKAINSKSREAMEVKSIKDFDVEKVNQFKEAVKKIFVTTVFKSTDLKEMVEELQNYVGSQLLTVNQYKEDHAGYPFTKRISDYHKALAEIKQTRSIEKLLVYVIDETASLVKLRDQFAIIKDFIDSNFTGYDQIRNFVQNEKSNIERLDESFEDRINQLKNFFATQDEPSHEYPAIRKIHKDIKTALDNQIKDLKEKVKNQYQEIFAELKQKKEELALTDSHLIADEETLISKIEKTNGITELEIFELSSVKFKLDNLKALADAHHQKTVKEDPSKYGKKLQSFNISESLAGKTLSSPEEVDALIEKLKSKLMVELTKNGKIFLE